MDIIRRIIGFNKRTREMHYQIPNSGRYIRDPQSNDFMTKYKCLSPEEFKKYNGGVCWDYVIYEALCFKKLFPDIKYDTFYFELKDANQDNPSHAVLIFYIDKKVYWFEASWKHNGGIYVFNTIHECLSYITDRLIEQAESDILDKKCIKYDALDKKFIGLGCVNFMEYMYRNYPEFEFNYIKNARYITILKD